MNTIKNLARTPLRVPLPHGKTLHLGLGQLGQVGDDALDHPAFKKLVDEARIEILGHGTGHAGSMGKADGAHVDTHGHGREGAAVPRRGDRGA